MNKNIQPQTTTLLFILALFTFGCRNHEAAKNNIKEANQAFDKQSKMEQCYPKNIFTKDNFFVKYHPINQDSEQFTLSWGNQHFERPYKDTFTCNFSDQQECGEFPHVEYVDEAYIYLIQAGDRYSANDCAPISFQQIILPKNNIDSTSTVHMYIKTEAGFAISSNGYDKIILTNHLNKSKQEFELVPPPSIGFKTVLTSIHSIVIDQNKLNVIYERLEGENENQLVKLNRTFNIE